MVAVGHAGRTATPTPTPTEEPPVPCGGDGDGRVSATDIVLIARAFFSTPPSPRWNAAADLNGNGIIDPNDLLLAVGSLLDRDCR